MAVIRMKPLNARDARLAGLARSVRAAIVVPSLFALALLVTRQPQAAGIAVFGTFAHLVMVNYDIAGRARCAEAALLTLLGAITVYLGAEASATVWLSVGGAVVAGFLTELLAVTGGRVAVIRTALLLSFMLAVAIPVSTGSVLPYLAGWLLAGLVAQPALLLVWVRPQTADGVEKSEASRASLRSLIGGAGPMTWIGSAAGTAMAMGLAVLLTRLLKLDHAFWVILGVLPVIRARGTSASRIFWHELAGTLIGFLGGASLAAIIGGHQLGYWLILPFIVFASTYASSAVGFVTGQTAFTVFAVVLFCILTPHQEHVGLARVENIAIGGTVSLAIGLLRYLGELCAKVAEGRLFLAAPQPKGE